jgi:glutaredoxin
MSEAKVIIYTTHDCGFCHRMLDWLEETGIEYEERRGAPSVADLGTERAAVLNGRPIEVVPTVVIGGRVMVDASKRQILQALKRAEEDGEN